MKSWGLVMFRTGLGATFDVMLFLSYDDPLFWWAGIGFVSSLASVPIASWLSRWPDGQGASWGKLLLLLTAAAPETVLAVPLLIAVLVSIPWGIAEAGLSGLWGGPAAVLVGSVIVLIPWVPSVVAVWIWWKRTMTTTTEATPVELS